MNGIKLAGKNLSGRAVLAFLLAMLICLLITAFAVVNRLDVEQLTMERLIAEKSNKANEAILNLLYKTQTLAVLAKQQNGYSREEFVRIASTLTDDPSIANMLIAPQGVVTDIYPRQGNEAVIGLDFFGAGAGNKEAVLAMETGELVMGGPFEAVQGQAVIVGRLPVFKTHEDGSQTFWGIVSVTLKYPEVLESIGLNEVHFNGLGYELWRINPDTGEKQIIKGSGYTSTQKVRYLEKSIKIQNAEWFFRIYPLREWYEYSDTWILVFLGLCISTLVAVVMQNNFDLKKMRDDLELLSRTDSLTGIYNRRYFTECALLHLERSERLNTPSALIMLDIDHFKNINDNLGHLAGDKVLQDITATISKALRPYDLFGRYGGEEFILFVTDISTDNAKKFTERIRVALMEKVTEYKDENIFVTCSFGITAVSLASDFYSATERADKALYAAKEGGRNMVVLYEEKFEAREN